MRVEKQMRHFEASLRGNVFLFPCNRYDRGGCEAVAIFSWNVVDVAWIVAGLEE